jgi:hypothetical protein
MIRLLVEASAWMKPDPWPPPADRYVRRVTREAK